nr:MAG TPA: hypothetical protein [Bacteriophage sp.]
MRNLSTWDIEWTLDLIKMRSHCPLHVMGRLRNL